MSAAPEWLRICTVLGRSRCKPEYAASTRSPFLLCLMTIGVITAGVESNLNIVLSWFDTLRQTGQIKTCNPLDSRGAHR